MTDQLGLLGSLMRQFHLHFTDPDINVGSLSPTLRSNYITVLKPLRNSTESLVAREKWVQDNIHLLPGMVYWRPPEEEEEPEPDVMIKAGPRKDYDGVLSQNVLIAIQREATRAHLLHGPDSMLGPSGAQRRLAILTEEYGEAVEEWFLLRLGSSLGRVSHLLTYDAPPDAEASEPALVRELVQVAAMAASWIEAIERNA